MDSDVIIVGDGLAGSSLAAILGKHNIRCLILGGRSAADTAKKTLDPRTLAITPASANILQHAGAWGLLPSEKIGHFRRMEVWDANGRGSITFDSAELCESTLGYIIEQTVLEEALRRSRSTLADCRHIPGPVVTGFRVLADAIEVSLEDGRRLAARLLVGADGSRSVVRELAGIAWPQHDYRQQAVAGIVDMEQPHSDVARQRFLSGGPLAFLPMHEPNRNGFVWSTRADHAEELLAMDENAFGLALAEAFAHRQGRVTGVVARAVFPLQHAHASRYCRSRLALVGDAAHVIHPLAGQGANMGLLDIAVLARQVIDQVERNRDPGSYSALRRYERWRRGENILMLRALQALNALYGSRSNVIGFLRNSGMELTDLLSPLKHRIMRHAMGLAGDLPDFARGKN